MKVRLETESEREQELAAAVKKLARAEREDARQITLLTKVRIQQLAACGA